MQHELELDSRNFQKFNLILQFLIIQKFREIEA